MLIRTIAEQDYPQAAEIHNAQNEPHWCLTSEQMRRSDEVMRERAPHYRRYIAEKDKEVIATGYLTPTWAGQTVPGRVWMSLFTRSDYRNTGVDTALLEHALTEFEQPIQEVWSCVREDFVPMSGYLEGFAEQFRTFGSELHLSEFDATTFAPLVKRLEAEGVVIKHYVDLSSDPNRDEKLLMLHTETEADAPYHEPIVPQHHPDIHDDDMDQSGVFVAVKDSEYVGYAGLEVDDKPHKNIGFTGVLRSYRNRGIGTVLGARAAEYAKSSGYTELGAGGAKENVAMQKVLRKLGFEIEPDWVTLAKTL